jgi:hypothetical protein
MKVICKENKATNLDPKEVTIVHSNDTYFPVTKGGEYIVMGMVIYKTSNCIYYLVNNLGRPHWIPYQLFDISDNQLPPHWFMKIFDKKTSPGGLFYLSGFDELCNNDDFHDALIESEQWALDIYFKRKDEIKEWHINKW